VTYSKVTFSQNVCCGVITIKTDLISTQSTNTLMRVSLHVVAKLLSQQNV